jgi:sec-independent protein translocase protein TatC
VHTAPFIDHLGELRRRLLYVCGLILIGSIITFIWYHSLIYWLVSPYTHLSLTTESTLYIHSLLEGFITKIKFSLYSGLILSFPFVLYHFLRFIIPGLKPKEKHMILMSLVLSVLLASISFYFTYFKLIPYSIQFLTSAQFIPQNIGLILNFYQNIFYIFTILMAAMLVFQLPILMGCLLYLNILKRAPLWRAGRYIAIGILILSALITPPDIITQLSIALPLTALYFVVLLVAKLLKWGEKDG